MNLYQHARFRRSVGYSVGRHYGPRAMVKTWVHDLVFAQVFAREGAAYQAVEVLLEGP